jgi:hypothetical protein
MSTVLGPTPCHDCKTPVSIVKRAAEVPCLWCDFHTTDNCRCAVGLGHTHAVPDVAWTVVEANGERHLCASNA